MKHCLRLLPLMAMIFLLYNCNSNNSAPKAPEEIVIAGTPMQEQAQAPEVLPPANSSVESFTSGIISRHSNVQISFYDNLPEMSEKELSKAFSISPNVEGVATISEKSIVFKPKKSLASNQKYQVDVNLNKIFGSKGAEKSFRFGFATRRTGLSVQPISIFTSDKTPDKFTFRGRIRTSDIEDPKILREIIKVEGDLEIVWDKAKTGNVFDFEIRNLEKTPQGRSYSLIVADNKYGYQSSTFRDFISTPQTETFEVVSIDYNDNSINVIFNRPLAEKKEKGIVRMKLRDDKSSDNDFEKSPRYTIRGNIMKIWPKSGFTNASITLSGNISDSKGNKLGSQDTQLTVDVPGNLPSLEFMSQGSILPIEGGAIVPFSATNLKGVIVRIIRIYPNNMGYFFQSNQLNETYGLARFGSLLCRKVIFLDELGSNDISKKNVYALDLRNYIDLEPGAIYNVMLSYNYDLSNAVTDTRSQKTRRELIELVAESEANDKISTSSLYFQNYSDNFAGNNWEEYNWNEKKDPTKKSYYFDNCAISKNLLSSDLGIIAKLGERGELFTSINNLSTAMPEPDVNVNVYNYVNQLIGSKKVARDGTATIDLQSNEPFYIVAEKGAQRGYLCMADNQSLSMSSFDVSGQKIQKGIKGFIYTDRGVWRPGDTIHISFLLDKRFSDLPETHPVTMQLYDPMQNLFIQKTTSIGMNGFYCFPTATLEDSPTGAWRCVIKVGGATFEKRIRVETIKPNRLGIELTDNEKMLHANKANTLKLHAYWLTGARASNLKYDITADYSRAKTEFSKYPDYIFDSPSAELNVEEQVIASGTTNSEGDATISVTPKFSTNTPGTLNGRFITKVYEPSGEFSIVSNNFRVSAYNNYVGIDSPQKDSRALICGRNNTFRVVTVNADGRSLGSRIVKVKIYKLYWSWWWSSSNQNLANYVSSSYNEPEKTFSIKTGSNGETDFEMNVDEKDWGTYYIQLQDEGGHCCGTLAYFDWDYDMGRDPEGEDRLAKLSVTTDKTDYNVGEDIVVRFPSSSESRAIITVENGASVVEHHLVECTSGETSFSIKATPEMMPNAYIFVSLINPFASTANDMPIRLYGIQPVNVNTPDSRLLPVITAPDEVKPGSKFKVVVGEKNNKPMTFTLAIVDEGLLNLTRFKTPSPWDAFNAKEALGVRTWDLYKYVIGAYGGKIEQIFSIGGDDMLDNAKGPSANRFKPVVIFKGPYTIKVPTSIEIDMPEYIGQVRCMVVAANSTSCGNTEKGIYVKQAVMAAGSLPRYAAPQDEIMVPVQVFAMEDNVGNVTVELETNNMASIVGASTQKLQFSTKGNKMVWFKVRIADRTGVAKFEAKAKSAMVTSVWKTELGVSSPLTMQTKVEQQIISKGESIKLDIQPFGLTGTNSGDLEVSTAQPLNISSRLSYLDNYQYQCVEQITSKGFANLLLPGLIKPGADQSKQMEQNVKSVISSLRNYSMSVGSFSYWPGTTSSNGWGSIYATHFLLRARTAGYTIQGDMLESALSYQATTAREWSAVNSPYLASEELLQAYRLYVLALAGKAEQGAMNRLAGKKDEIPPVTRWMLAAAYSAFGQNKQAGTIYETYTIQTSDNDTQRLTYGSDMRNQAIQLIALLGMGRQKSATEVESVIAEYMRSDKWMSTQTTSFCLIALSEYFKKYPASGSLKFDAAVDGQKYNIDEKNLIWSTPLPTDGKDMSASIKNKSDGTLYATLRTSGIPTRENIRSYTNGLSIQINYYDTKGNPLEVRSLPQNKDFRMKVTVLNNSAINLRDVMLTQMIPAGWEIINTRYMDENESEGNSTGNHGITYQDIRDNKVDSYIPVLSPSRSVECNLMLNASYAGTYYLAPSYCEAMYDGDIRANSAGMEITVVKE